MKLELWKGQLLDTALGKTNYSIYTLMFMVLSALVIACVFNYVYNLANAKLIVKAEVGLRKNYFTALLKKNMSEYITIPEGKINADYTDKIATIRSEYFITLSLVVQHLLLFIVALTTLFLVNAKVAAVEVLASCVPIFLPVVLKKPLLKKSKAQMQEIEKHFSLVQTWLKGFDIIKVFSAEKYLIFRYDKTNELLRKKEMEFENVKTIETSLSFIGSAFVHIVMAAYCAYLVFLNSITAGEYYSVMGLIGLLSAPMFWAARRIKSIYTSRPARQAMVDFIEAYHKAGIEKLENFTIEAKDVTFGYTEEKILIDANFTFKQHEKILILGESGSGKSTIMKLLLGMYTPDTGSLTIGGVPPAEIKNITDVISIQQQEVYIFKMNLMDNLLLDDTIHIETVKETLTAVGLNKYTSEKYLKETVIGEEYGFSGGEKKRIGIARAVLRKRPIMIFDEPFANIDNENMEKVKHLILGIKDATVIIISHIVDDEIKKLFDTIYWFKNGCLN